MFPSAVQDPPILAADSPASPRQVVVVAAAGQRFGIPIGTLREVIPPRAFTPLPGSAAWVSGLINVRGRIVTTIDLGACIGAASCVAHPDHRIVLFEHAGTLAGLVVDEVVRIVSADAAELRQATGALRALRPGATFLQGIGTAEGFEFAVLDPDALCRSVLA